jgi:hypothetical protein
MSHVVIMKDQIHEYLSLQEDGPATKALENAFSQESVSEYLARSSVAKERASHHDSSFPKCDFEMQEIETVLKSLDDSIFFPAIEWCYDNDSKSSNSTQKTNISPDCEFRNEQSNFDQRCKRRKLSINETFLEGRNREEFDPIGTKTFRNEV